MLKISTLVTSVEASGRKAFEGDRDVSVVSVWNSLPCRVVNVWARMVFDQVRNRTQDKECLQGAKSDSLRRSGLGKVLPVE